MADDDAAQILPKDPTTSTTAALAEGRHGITAGAVFNMALAILGPGVLTVPHALASGGYAVALAMLAASAVLNVYTIDLLILSALTLKPSERTFRGVATAALGKRAAIFVDVNVAIYLFGCVCGNLIAISTLGARYLHWVGWDVEQNLVLVASVILVLPVCICRDLTLLGKVVSPIGVAALFSVVVCISISYFIGSHKASPAAYNFDSDALYAFPIATFSFSAQVPPTQYTLQLTGAPALHLRVTVQRGVL